MSGSATTPARYQDSGDHEEVDELFVSVALAMMREETQDRWGRRPRREKLPDGLMYGEVCWYCGGKLRSGQWELFRDGGTWRYGCTGRASKHCRLRVDAPSSDPAPAPSTLSDEERLRRQREWMAKVNALRRRQAAV